MRRGGRKSETEKETDLVVIQGGFATAKVRPEPPDDLTPRQADIWRATIDDETQDHFSTKVTQQMLADYCRHRETIENLAITMNDFDPGWLKSREGAKRFAQLLKMRDLATRGASSLATKLRLTNQSRYNPITAHRQHESVMKGSKPWDWDPPIDGAS